MVNKKRNKKSNNALSLGKMIENTKENIEAAEMNMEYASDEELENLEEKNSRRRQSVAQMEEQLKEQKAFEARKRSFE